MAENTEFVAGPDVAEDEEVRDRKGRIIDEDYAEAAADDALRQARGRGRPSLSESGESPLLRVRLPHDLDDGVTDAARRAGTSRAEWVRQALQEAIRKAS